MAIKKKMQMGGEIGAFSKLKGAAKKKELDNYKNYGDGPGSGPSIDKTKKPAPKATAGMKKAQAGAKVKSDMQAAPKKKAAISPTGTFRSQGMNAPKMAKSGGSLKKCKYGCK